jgi:hypothetical protein
MFVDKLLRQFNEGGYYAIEYSDDTAILINEKFPETA